MLKKILGNKKMLADIILVASLLVVSLSVFLVFSLTREEGSRVVVSVNGDDVSEYSLARDGEYTLTGGTNTIVIENGKVYMKDANCPDGLCIHQGKKSMNGERIVCLPNRVEVRVEGDGEEILGG
jgi:hypothetical protein